MRSLLSFLAVLLLATGLQARKNDTGEGQDQGQGKDEGHHYGELKGNNGQGEGNKASPPRQVPEHFRQKGVQSMPRIFDRRHVMREENRRSNILFPRTGPVFHDKKPRLFSRKMISSPLVHDHFRAIMHDHGFLGSLPQLQRAEREEGHYYWHRWNEVDYCHYYDPWGYHWYGWYLGPRFFWVRVFGGRWWWYDPVQLRWCFWWDGDWWWPDPFHVNVLFLYRDGDYVSSEPEAAEPDSSSALPDDEEMIPPAEPAPEKTVTAGKAPYIDPKDMPPAPEEVPSAPPAQ
jgi:hypothetical protein